MRDSPLDLLNPWIDCLTCCGGGRCIQCRGLGRAGLIRSNHPADSFPCWRCSGNGTCSACCGEGKVRSFRPHIKVETSRRNPTSISVAAFSGAPWRFLSIPKAILRRSIDEQRGWCSWRIQRYHRDEGPMCPLFGRIIGYSWRPTSGTSIGMNHHGALLDREPYEELIRLVKEASDASA